jgi:hypothetical protein
MVIAYRTRAVPVQTFDVSVECPACKVNGTTTFYIYSEHVDVFWIPFVATDKLAISRCANCKQAYTTKYVPGLNVFNEMAVTPVMPFELSTFFYQKKKKIMPRWWQYTGVGMIILSFIFFVFQELQQNKKTEEYFVSPMAGDVYQIKMDDENYTTFKVKDVTNDSMHVFFNKWIVDDEKGFDKLDGKEFDPNVSSISRLQLAEMKNEFKVRRIIRE